MSTIVCQNLVSRFESQITETTTTLKLRVAAPPTPPPPPAEVKTNPDFGNWGCLLTASNENSIGKENNFYTHPLDKKKSLFSALSTKSLELCTENLGSETGTDIVTESSGAAVFSATPSVYTSNSNSGGNPSPRKIEKPNRETKTPINIHYAEDDSRRKIKNFPPPLTTISGRAGSSSLQVRRHTEGGRLIIEAVEAPVRSSCLQAERSGGRLRLCLLTGSDSAATTTGEEVENGNECGGETEEEEEINDSMTEIESEEDEEFDEEVNLEMEIEKIQRLSRCKERSSHGNNRGFCSDFKPALWVATS